MRIRQGDTKCNHTSNEKVLGSPGSHKKKIFFFLESGDADPCASMWNKIFPFSVFTVSCMDNLE